MRSIASDGNLDEVSEFGVPGREFSCCCCTANNIIIGYKMNMLWVWDFKYGEPSLLLGVSGVDLLPGTISRLKLDTLSRKDNAGLGGATGRCGRVFEK